jgi:hypothetical protein
MLPTPARFRFHSRTSIARQLSQVRRPPFAARVLTRLQKKEATDVPRQAVVIGGPRLQQEANETAERFEARVRAIAHQLRNENEQVA